MRDIVILCALILAVSAGAFAGSAAAIHIFKEQDAAEMVALRAQVEPSVCRLFARAGTP